MTKSRRPRPSATATELPTADGLAAAAAPTGRGHRGVTVEVVVSDEEIDMEAWARDYVHALFEARGFRVPASF